MNIITLEKLLTPGCIVIITQHNIHDEDTSRFVH